MSLFRNWAEGNLGEENKNLTWLTGWYSRHCNGDWEHEFGLKIRFSKDLNCHILIDIANTECGNQQFHPTYPALSNDSFIEYFVRDEKFYAECNPINISYSLEVFRKWSNQFRDQSNDFCSSSILFQNCENQISNDQIPIAIKKIKTLLKIINAKKN